MDGVYYIVRDLILSFSVVSMTTCYIKAYKAGKVVKELTEGVDEAEYAAQIFRNKVLELLYSTAGNINFIIAYLVSR